MNNKDAEHKAHVNQIYDDVVAAVEGTLKNKDYDPENEDSNETIDLREYLSDCYDIEFTVGMDNEVRSVRFMVACGGPNIWVSSCGPGVELFWWGSHEETFEFPDNVREALLELANEIRNC